MKFYKESSLVIFSGEYINGFRVGQWSIEFQEKPIGGGNYNEKGEQDGQWTDLHPHFNQFCQVTLTGEYRNGIRINKWSINQEKKIIGGGTYDENGLQNGQWKVLHENYDEYQVLKLCNSYCEVTFSGQFKQGIRFGEWSTAYKGKYIGGGTYDQHGVKIGDWVDIHEKFNEQSSFYDSYCFTTLSGQYRNGIKFGEWSTKYKNNKMQVCGFDCSGDGSYDEKGIKIGEWTDLHENFNDSCQVTFKGKFRNGIRIGEWYTLFKGIQIGGGTYNDEGVKTGQWVDLHDTFCEQDQVTYSGKYHNGFRIGKWMKKDQFAETPYKNYS